MIIYLGGTFALFYFRIIKRHPDDNINKVSQEEIDEINNIDFKTTKGKIELIRSFIVLGIVLFIISVCLYWFFSGVYAVFSLK